MGGAKSPSGVGRRLRGHFGPVLERASALVVVLGYALSASQAGREVVMTGVGAHVQ